MKHHDQTTASRLLLTRSQRETFPYEVRAFGLRVLVERGVFSPKHFHGWKTFTRHFPSVLGKDVLEIGCGTGITAMVIALRGARSIVATDVSRAAVRNARKNVRLNGLVGTVEIRHGDLFAPIAPRERFDAVYWNMPFMPAPEAYRFRSMLERSLFDPGYRLTRAFLENGTRVLRPGGRLLVGTADFGDVDQLRHLARAAGYRMRLLAREAAREIHRVEFQLFELRLNRPSV